MKETNIENSLVNYDRENVSGSKESQIILYKHEADGALKAILTRQLGIKVVVIKNGRSTS